MKGMRIILVLAAAIAVIALIGYLISKRNAGLVVQNSSSTPLPSTIGTSGDVPSDPRVQVATAAKEVVIEASEFKFSPSEVRVKKGETVKIILKNTGRMPHNWMVEKMGGASIDVINGGSTGSIVMTPSQKGTFTTFCSVGTHRQQGMVGKLIVE